MKKIIYISLLTSILINGCGNNSSVTDADVNYDQQDIFSAIPVNVEYTNYNVKVVDDIIVGGNVRAYECNSSTPIKDKPGWYELQNCVSKPSFITVEGGMIGDTNVTQKFPLILNTKLSNKDDNFIITPLTTLIANADEDEAKDIANKFDLDLDDIFKDPKDIQKDINITNSLQKINAIYLKAVSDGAVANKLNFLKVVRDKIKDVDIKDGDFNVTDVAQKVEKESVDKPQLFGLVFIGDLDNDDDILAQIKKAQTPDENKVRFLGLVFDDKVNDANVSVYRADTNESLIEDDVTSDDNGKWVIEFNQSVIDTINKEDFIVVFEAVKTIDSDNDKKIKLKTTLSTNQLRLLIKNNKNITPSTTPDLVVSNITTVESAILDKQGLLESDNKDDIQKFDTKKVQLKTYYQDKILKVAAVVKDIVDNNNTDLLDDDQDTFNFIVTNIEANDSSDNVEYSDGIENNDTTDLEQNITDNVLLNQQLLTTQTYINTANDNSDITTFEDVAKKNGNVFYRVLAYYQAGDDGDLGTDDDIFVREYSKIITLPGKYETKTCYLYGDDTTDWKDCKKETFSTANFSAGNYNVQNKDKIISYSLESNNSIYVSDLNKYYILFDVSKQTLIASDVIDTTPEVLVDSFDVVDMFRRMPDMDEKSFDDLKNEVNASSREEVNIRLNRYIKEQMDNIKEYFSE